MTSNEFPNKQKAALVTGATNGIGKITALELARAGYRVLLTSRDAAKGERVLGEIRIATGNSALELFVGDLSSMSDVRRIALEVGERHPKLDVLVNNAGGVFQERSTTADGFETTFAFNHLAYFLLTNLLLPNLNAAGAARVVSVSSNSNNIGRMRWDDLQAKREYNSGLVYAQSKLMNVLFANALARRLRGTGVTSNSLHPGIVNTGFGKTIRGPIRVIYWVTNLISVTAEQGAQTSLYLATSPEVAGVTGQYFATKKVARANRVAYDESAQERLWRLSEEQLEPWLNPVDDGPAVVHR